MRAATISFHFQRGISYVEVLVAIVLIAVTLVPAIESLHSGIIGADIHQNYAVDHYQLVSKFEEVLAQPYSSLLMASAAAASNTVASSYSDAAATVNRRIVYLSYYDAANSDADSNPFTILDADTDGDNDPYTGSDVDISLLWVRVEIEGTVHVLETLVNR